MQCSTYSSSGSGSCMHPSGYQQSSAILANVKHCAQSMDNCHPQAGADFGQSCARSLRKLAFCMSSRCSRVSRNRNALSTVSLCPHHRNHVECLSNSTGKDSGLLNGSARCQVLSAIPCCICLIRQLSNDTASSLPSLWAALDQV